MKIIALVLLLLTVHGCTYHWQSEESIEPVTYDASAYQSGKSIGKLRRLILMPANLESKEKDLSLEEMENAAKNYQDACATFLREKKGYEIIVVREKGGGWALPDEYPRNARQQELYQKWHEEPPGEHSAEIIKNLGLAFHGDGVLVIRIKEQEPWGAMEGLLNIALMNIPLFYHLATADIGAWIYESSSGGLVWREERSVTETASSGDALVDLFADFENALPFQLVK